MMLRNGQRVPARECDFEPDEAAELYAALGAGWKPLDLRSAATRGRWMVGRSRDGGYYAHIRDGAISSATVLWSGEGPTPSDAILNAVNRAEYDLGLRRAALNAAHRDAIGQGSMP